MLSDWLFLGNFSCFHVFNVVDYWINLWLFAMLPAWWKQPWYHDVWLIIPRFESCCLSHVLCYLIMVICFKCGLIDYSQITFLGVWLIFICTGFILSNCNFQVAFTLVLLILLRLLVMFSDRLLSGACILFARLILFTALSYSQVTLHEILCHGKFGDYV